ncbi:MAG: aminotransferase class IV [Candidatus Desulfofervidaceae bacterium]|nr:aminotransferase class IV [Candidatus Desulfofervidaceae bacterium]
MKIFSADEILQKLLESKNPYWDSYLAMYSSLWGGVVTDPGLMLVPIDDHMVHRGDAVFEVIKCRYGRIYQFNAHLERLKTSAEAVGIVPALSFAEIKNIVRETVQLSCVQDCVIHIYLSRGPGGFTVNPFESKSSQLYVVVTKWQPLPPRFYEEGVKVVLSHIPVKPSFFARIKSCNYLPNVLMKKEALEVGADFAVALDEKGNLAEGATESIGLVSADGYLKFPQFERILKGITLQRAAFLGQKLKQKGLIKDILFCPIPLEEVYKAKEIFLFGTTVDILPVTLFEGKTVGAGTPGQIFRALKTLFEQDLFSDEVSEPIWQTSGEKRE